MRIISPSLLSADFSNISDTIKKIEDTGANRLHLDVMDGYFVPALTFGPMIIKEIRKCTRCHLETHLMIRQPYKTIDQYINVGSDTIMIHLEASLNPIEELSYIRANNVCAGIAINPETEEITEWESPSGANSEPYFLEVIDDIIWYDESGKRPDALVRFDPQTETFQSWAIPSEQGFYGAIARHGRATPDGDLLLHQGSSNNIMRIKIGKSD